MSVLPDSRAERSLELMHALLESEQRFEEYLRMHSELVAYRIGELGKLTNEPVDYTPEQQAEALKLSGEFLRILESRAKAAQGIHKLIRDGFPANAC
jgi:hypothetical protein